MPGRSTRHFRQMHLVACCSLAVLSACSGVPASATRMTPAGGRSADPIEEHVIAAPAPADQQGFAPACAEQPRGARSFRVHFTITNSPSAIGPQDPDFPDDFCPAGSILYNTADGKGIGTHLGAFTLRDRYCLQPPLVIGEARFVAANGDRLDASYTARPTVLPPQLPNAAEFTGSGDIIGGTGRFAGVTGRFEISGKQLGELIPNTSIAKESAFVFCGYLED